MEQSALFYVYLTGGLRMFCIFCGQQADETTTSVCPSCGQSLFLGNTTGNPPRPSGGHNSTGSPASATYSGPVATAASTFHTQPGSYIAHSGTPQPVPATGAGGVSSGGAGASKGRLLKVLLAVLIVAVLAAVFFLWKPLGGVSGSSGPASYNSFYGGELKTQPYIASGSVYFLDRQQNIFALSGGKDSLEKINPDQLNKSHSLLIGDTLYYLAEIESDRYHKRLYSMNLKKGTVELHDDISADMMCYDGEHLFIRLKGGDDVSVLDPSSLKTVDTINTPGMSNENFLAVGGKFYYFESDNRGSYRVVDLKSGSTSTLEEQMYHLCGNDQAVYFTQPDGKLYTIPHSSGKKELLLDLDSVVGPEYSPAPPHHLYLDGDYLYFNYYCETRLGYQLYRVKTDGTGLQAIDSPEAAEYDIDSMAYFAARGGWLSAGSYSIHIEKDKITEMIMFGVGASRTELDIPLVDLKIK